MFNCLRYTLHHVGAAIPTGPRGHQERPRHVRLSQVYLTLARRYDQVTWTPRAPPPCSTVSGIPYVIIQRNIVIMNPRSQSRLLGRWKSSRLTDSAAFLAVLRFETGERGGLTVVVYLCSMTIILSLPDSHKMWTANSVYGIAKDLIKNSFLHSPSN
jgi:hypothetical protein